MPDRLMNFDNIRILPSIHGRVAFAAQVRKIFAEQHPGCIAVELPAGLRDAVLEAVGRLPQITAVCYRERGLEARLCYLPVSPVDSIVEAIRVGLENDIPVEFVDLDAEPFEEETAPMPDDSVVDKIGLRAYARLSAATLPLSRPGMLSWRRERHMAWRLKQLRERHDSILFVCGMTHLSQVYRFYSGNMEEASRPDPPENVFLAHIPEPSLSRALREIPNVAFMYEKMRSAGRLGDGWRFDKLEAIRTIYLRCEKPYRKRYKQEINVTQWRTLLQFTRNLALTRMNICPEFYEVVVGAKNTVDGDYGAIVHEMASSYPPQRNFTPYPSLELLPRDRGRLGESDERHWLRPRPTRPPEQTVRVRFRRRPNRRERQIWKELWDRTLHMGGICSWPPEDKIQEDFMAYVRKRALQIVSEDKKRTLEFSTSFLDGLDLRETIRNWHTKKLFVQDAPPPRGKVGPVVLIFENEPIDARGSWRVTLYAEHQNESDISFYADPLGEHVVGPGICRTHFRGILSVFPAKRIPDVWTNPTIDEYPTCAEKLLAAAIFYSDEKYVAYIAPHPPSASMKQLAGYNERQIIYIPIFTFSRQMLRKIRKFHILDGHHVRAFAADYIV